MPDEEEPKNLSQVLDQLLDKTDGNDLSLGDVLGAFSNRAYGPLPVLPGFIVTMPTGTLPLVTHVMGIFVALICLQMFFARSSIWLPQRLRDFAVPRDRFKQGVDWVRP